MLKTWLFLILLIPLAGFSQVSITAHVADITTKKPVDNASVILSNTTIGSRTAEDGSFKLSNVKPGQYDLVVSIVGYETYHYTVKVTSENLVLPALEILPKSVTLNEVVVKPDPNWARNFDVFKKDFIGSGPEAALCKIINPDVIDLKFDAQERVLTATSYDFIEIVNKALGYRIKFLLTNFTNDFKNNTLYFEGSVLFQELKASGSKLKKWQKARDNAYYGSLAHFLKSSLRDQASEQGFKTLQLIRKPNPERQPEELIQAKLKFFRKQLPGSQAAIDSIGYWGKQDRLPKKVSYLVSTPLNTFNLLRRTDQKGLYALTYNDNLYVIYTKKRDDGTNQPDFHPLDAPNNPITIITFAQKNAIFDDNGVLVNPAALIFEGAWGKSRVSTMLPVDYEPTTVKAK